MASNAEIRPTDHFLNIVNFENQLFIFLACIIIFCLILLIILALK